MTEKGTVIHSAGSKCEPDCKGNQISCFKKENDHLQGQEGISFSALIGNTRQLDG